MASIVKVTRRGQTTIPKNIRKELNIKEGDYLLVETDGKKIIFMPLKRVEDLAGIFADVADVAEIKKQIESMRSEY
ncbi:MAG: AbrB/MazE/SpoVT family DNA-binding domain-containing protein [Candidatus Asgardarchaeia archaeon]|nr:AbrB/MazE/SpoVT family DNA-binding domain-containing protein [Candidatus Odinarchaeota archaeon]